MKFIQSKNLKNFKNEIGQANHFLITILIGLDGIRDGKIKKKDEFRTTWYPQNIASSVDRSKVYAKKSALTWVVDNFDTYLRRCNEEPKLLPNSEYESMFDGNGRSVYKNFITLTSNLECNETTVAMVDLLICWRNRLVHYKAMNDIDPRNRKLLLDHENELFSEHNSLDIKRMLENFDSKGTPTFKELTSLTKSIIDLVYQLDKILISKLDLSKYMDKVIIDYVREDIVKRIDKLYSGDQEDRLRVLRNVIKEHGFEEEKDVILDEMLNQIANLKISEFKKCVSNHSFI